MRGATSDELAMQESQRFGLTMESVTVLMAQINIKERLMLMRAQSRLREPTKSWSAGQTPAIVANIGMRVKQMH